MFRFISLILITLFLFLNNLKANEKANRDRFVLNYDREHSDRFGKLLVKDKDGRIKPINTIALNSLKKIYGDTTIYGLNANQIFLGMFLGNKYWQKEKIIKISNPKIKELLGMEKNQNYIDFASVFDIDKKSYKLLSYVNEALKKPPFKRDKFDIDILKVDEKINLCNEIFSVSIYKIFPKEENGKNIWIDPKSALINFSPSEVTDIRELISRYFKYIKRGQMTNNWSRADIALDDIKAYQKEIAGDNIPSEIKIGIEILYNKFDIFNKIEILYLSLALSLLFLEFVKIDRSAKLKIQKSLLNITLFTYLFHTTALVVRWYILNSLSWSNIQEIVIYIFSFFISISIIFISKIIFIKEDTF